MPKVTKGGDQEQGGQTRSIKRCKMGLEEEYARDRERLRRVVGEANY